MTRAWSRQLAGRVARSPLGAARARLAPVRAAAARLALAAVVFLPAVLPPALAGQEPDAPAAVARRPLVRVTPALAWGIGGLGGSDVTSASVRVEVPVGAYVAPWVSYSEFQLGIACIPEAEVCPEDGSAWVAGLLLESRGGRGRVRPYLAAGLGQWRNEAERDVAYSVLFGAALELIPVLAPAFEMRWERYPVFRDQTLVAVGLQLTLPRPGRRS